MPLINLYIFKIIKKVVRHFGTDVSGFIGEKIKSRLSTKTNTLNDSNIKNEETLLTNLSKKSGKVLSNMSTYHF
jgi:hypothetical protein